MSKAARCLRCMTPMIKSTCGRCGWEDDAVYDLQYIRPGTVLSGRYLLGELVRKNGEGALYAGFDNSLQQMVWVREYFPQTIAQRDLNTGKVTPLAGCGAQYKALMSDFVDICNEIRRLSATDPVVPLENVISENNTVYAVYKGLALTPFEQFLERQGGKLPAKQAVALLIPICNALGTLHSHGQIHRGISPYTLYTDGKGKLYLWDFALSATRTAGSELDAELFSGYSAPEQYSPSGWQGSWTDIYAMGALLYRTLTGIVPPKSIRIDENHPLAPLSQEMPELPSNLSGAVESAMHPDTQERTQAIQTFVSRMIDSGTTNTAVFDTNKVQRAAQKQEQEREKSSHKARKKRGGTAKYVFLGLFAMLAVLGGIIWWFVQNINDFIPTVGNPEESSQQSSQAQESQPEESEAEASLPDNTMPNFFKQRLEDVENDPRYERFKFDVVEVFSDDYEEGLIVDQKPIESEPIRATGSVLVTLEVSKGPARHEMPNLVGRTEEEAKEILGNLEFVTVEVVADYQAGTPGTISRTMPAAEEEFDPRNRTVLIYVIQEVSAVEGSRPPERPSDDPAHRPDDDGYTGPIFRN